MMISLLTTMRQGDILKLRFDEIHGGMLRVIIGKSEAQRGSASATRLAWNLDEHPELAQVIERARESAQSHLHCPFVIHYKTARARAYP